MAFSARATNLTPNYEVAGGTGPLDRIYSRWLDGAADPSNDAIAHIVREVKATGSLDEIGIHYVHYDMSSQSVVRELDIVAATSPSGGQASERAPRIAANGPRGKLWTVWIASTGNSQNSPGSAGSVKVSQSTLTGASWSSPATISTGDSYVYPCIGFGIDGSGFIIAYNSTQGRYDYFRYDKTADSWDAPVNLLTPASPQASASAVAVDHEGNAYAIVDNKPSTTQSSPKLMYWNGTAWSQGSTIETASPGSNVTITFPVIRYDVINLQYMLAYGFQASQNARGAILSRNGIVSNLTSTGGPSIFSGPAPQATMNGTLDQLGNLNFLVTGTGSANPDVYQYAVDGTWSKKADLDYDGQASPFPNDSAYGGSFHVYNEHGFALWVADENGGVSNEDLWVADDPEYIDLPEGGVEAEYGCIVGLQTYAALESGAIKRRLIVYAGNGVYDDQGTGEPAGNLISTGAFEPIPSMVVFNGDLYIADGVNTLKRWNPSLAAAVTVTGAPKAAGVFAAANRLWAWEEGSQRLYYSKLLDGTTWQLTDAPVPSNEEDPLFLDLFDFLEGEPITAGIEFLGARFIFTENSYVRITGETPGYSSTALSANVPLFSVKLGSSNTGCFAKNALVNVGSDVFFVSRKGLHSLRTTDTAGAIEESYLSYPIQPFFDGLSKATLRRSQAVHYRRRNWYVIAIPGTADGGALKTVLVYDYAQQKWARWEFDFEICSLHSRINSALDKEELLAGTNLGFIVKLDQTVRKQQVGSEEYEAVLRTSWIHPGTLRSHSEFTRIFHFFNRPSLGEVNTRYWVDRHQPVTEVLDVRPSTSAGDKTSTIGFATIGVDARIGATPGGSSVLVDSINLNRGGKKGRMLMYEVRCPTGDMEYAGSEIQMIPGSFRDSSKE